MLKLISQKKNIGNSINCFNYSLNLMKKFFQLPNLRIFQTYQILSKILELEIKIYFCYCLYFN